MSQIQPEGLVARQDKLSIFIGQMLHLDPVCAVKCKNPQSHRLRCQNDVRT